MILELLVTTESDRILGFFWSYSAFCFSRIMYLSFSWNFTESTVFTPAAPNCCLPHIPSRGPFFENPVLEPSLCSLWMGCSPGCQALILPEPGHDFSPRECPLFLWVPCLPLFWIIVILYDNSSLFQICSIGICTIYRPSGAEKTSHSPFLKDLQIEETFWII